MSGTIEQQLAALRDEVRVLTLAVESRRATLPRSADDRLSALEAHDDDGDDRELALLRIIAESVSEYFLQGELEATSDSTSALRRAHLAKTEAQNRVVETLQLWRRLK